MGLYELSARRRRHPAGVLAALLAERVTKLMTPIIARTMRAELAQLGRLRNLLEP